MNLNVAELDNGITKVSLSGRLDIKAATNNGGKLALLNPQPNVERLLRTSHVDTVMPIAHNLSAIQMIFGA